MHPLLKKLNSFYNALAADLPLPPATALHPEDLYWLEGCFCTISVLKPEKDYRFEICGPLVRLFSGHDLRAHTLSEMEPRGDVSGIRSDLDQVVLARRPRYSTGSIIWEDTLKLECEWLILPFTGHHGRISMLLVAEKTQPAPGSRLPLPGSGKLPRLEMRAMVWPAFHRPATRPHKPAAPHHHA